MKNIISKIILVAATVLAYGCEQKDCCQPLNEENVSMAGEWLLYERGYSPGQGYVIDEVPAEPEQKIEFYEDRRFIHSLDSLEAYKYYLILDDPDSGQKILSLYTQFTPTDDVYSLKHSYNIVFEEGSMKLYYRSCIEGCHMGFRRITTK